MTKRGLTRSHRTRNYVVGVILILLVEFATWSLGYLRLEWIAGIGLSTVVLATIFGGRKREWSRKRKINLFLLYLWVAFLLTTVLIPAASYGREILPVSQGWIKDNLITWTQNGQPEFANVFYSVTLSAVGALSVQNSVTYTVTEAFNVTSPGGIVPPNLVYCCVGFSNATYYSDSQITLQKQPDGTLAASGTLNYRDAGHTYFIIAQNASAIAENVYPFPRDAKVLFVGTPWTIGPMADTETAVFNESAIKFAFILGSFSVLFLQPIFEGIFVKKGEE